MFTVHKPYYGHTEVHAAAGSPPLAGAPATNGGGAATGLRPGLVPGRAVLGVPDDSLAPRNTLGMQPGYAAPSRLRIFSGTSNPVSDWAV